MREKTVTISFRLSKGALDALRQDARKNNTSVNTLANQIFEAYAEHDRFLQKLQMVKLSIPTLKQILSADSKEGIAEAGRKAGEAVPEAFILAKMGELNAANAIQYLRLMGTYANLFDYSEVSLPQGTSLALTHDMGGNWSIFLSAYVRSLFERAGGSVRIMTLENAVRIELGLRPGGEPRGRTSPDTLQMSTGDT